MLLLKKDLLEDAKKLGITLADRDIIVIGEYTPVSCFKINLPAAEYVYQNISFSASEIYCVMFRSKEDMTLYRLLGRFLEAYDLQFDVKKRGLFGCMR